MSGIQIVNNKVMLLRHVLHVKNVADSLHSQSTASMDLLLIYNDLTLYGVFLLLNTKKEKLTVFYNSNLFLYYDSNVKCTFDY